MPVKSFLARPLAIIIAFSILGREVLKTLADYEGDLRQQCRTVSTVWGKQKARIIFFVLLAIAFVVMLVRVAVQCRWAIPIPLPSPPLVVIRIRCLPFVAHPSGTRQTACTRPIMRLRLWCPMIKF